MISTASKEQPFVPRPNEIAARRISAAPTGARSVFPGWGPKV